MKKILATVWVERTGLEQILMLVSSALIGLIVALTIALSRKFAPWETEWGAVADWVGVAVTFLGFVGAIAALKVQSLSVNVQLEQHEKVKTAEVEAKSVEAAAQAAEAADAASAAQEKRKEHARSVELKVTASRPKPPAGATFSEPQPFEVKCLLAFTHSGKKFTDVKFEHPDTPKGFRVRADDAASTDLSTVGLPARIWWVVSGPEWHHGNEDDAQGWVAERTYVTFTDPSGLSWKLDGHGNLTETTVAVEAGV